MIERLTPDATLREGLDASLIRLSDGADWSFMRPAVRLRPEVAYDLCPGGRKIRRIRVGIYFGYPAEIEVLITKLRRACDEESIPHQYEAFFTLAVALLRRAHDISVDDACRLLDVAESETNRLIGDVIKVISYREERFCPPNAESPEHESTRK